MHTRIYVYIYIFIYIYKYIERDIGGQGPGLLYVLVDARIKPQFVYTT